MTDFTFDRSLCVKDVGRTEVRINVHKPWQTCYDHLLHLLPEELHASDLWRPESGPILLNQLLTGGPSFTMVPTGFVGQNHWLTKLHADYMRGSRQNSNSQCLVVPFGSHPHRAELFLVPINAWQGKAKKTVPAFLGYILPEHVAVMAESLVSKSLLPVVLDLDETLLVAHSASQLEGHITKARIKRDQASADVRAAINPQSRQECQQRESAWMQEMQNLEKDLDLLKQFRETNTVTLPGGYVERAKFEPARVDNGIVLQRPVIRLDGGVVLTRIDPRYKLSSMIMRLRPGWDALRAFLAAPAQGQPGGKKRFDVYVCTAAERPYALEAWRLLDSRNDIIPEDLRSDRIFCSGSQRKELRRVLGVQAPIAFESEGAEPQAACAMPLAIIVDDRLDVWEPQSQAQVLQVAPFAPYRPPTLDNAQMASPQAMQDEMAAVRARMYAIRSNAYWDINHELKPAVTALTRDGQPLQKVLTSISEALPAIRTVADLLKVPNLQNAGPAPPPAPPQGHGEPPTGPPQGHGTPPTVPPQDHGGAPNAPSRQQPMPASLQPIDPRRPNRTGSLPRHPLQRPATIAPPDQQASSSAAVPGMAHEAARTQAPSAQQQQQQQQQPEVGLSNGQNRRQQQKQLPPPMGLRQPTAAHQMPNGFHAQASSSRAGQGIGAVPNSPVPSAGNGSSGTVPNGPAQAAGNGPSRAVATGPLHVDLALPEIRQQTARANFNPVSVLKEASDKQKAGCRFLDEAVKPLGQHEHFLVRITWEGQEIAAVSGHDKKTAKKEAAKKAIQFLLQYSPPASTAPVQQPSQQQAAAQASASGTATGASPKNPGAPAGQAGNFQITENNALATLQQAYPKEVKPRTLQATSGQFCEAIHVMDGHHVVEATASSKKMAQRWAAMRLLMELNWVLEPTFFADTPEGRQADSKGPTQKEFQAATRVTKFEGKPTRATSRPNRPQPKLQSRQQQQPQHRQQQDDQQEDDQRRGAQQQHQQQQQQRLPMQHLQLQEPEQASVSSDASHRKRSAVDDDSEVSRVKKKGKHAAATAGPLNWAWTAWAQSENDKEDDIDMNSENAQDEDVRDMSAEPAEQSGYPSHTFDEDRPSSGDAEEEEEGPAGSSGGGSGSSHTENDQPVKGVNMQSGDHKTFLAAVKKQSKVKEGAWSEVRQQSDEHDLDDGTIEID